MVTILGAEAGPRSVSFQNPSVRSGGEGSGSGSEGGSRRGMEGGLPTIGSLGVIKMAEMRDLLRRLKFTRFAFSLFQLVNFHIWFAQHNTFSGQLQAWHIWYCTFRCQA